MQGVALGQEAAPPVQHKTVQDILKGVGVEQTRKCADKDLDENPLRRSETVEADGEDAPAPLP